MCRLRKWWEGLARSLEVAVCRVNTSNDRVPVQPWKDWTSMENQFDNYQVLKNVITQKRLGTYTQWSCRPSFFLCFYSDMALTIFPSHYQQRSDWRLTKMKIQDICLSKLWKFEKENIWLCRNDVGECDTLDSPWTIKCTNSPKDSQRPLPVNKLCLGPALFIRQQQQRAADKRSLASFVVHCTSSRQPLLWAVM